MPYAQFIKDVGIMNGYVGYHKITGKQQLKHILAYVSGLYDNARSISFYSGLFQCRYNQLLMDPIKIYFVLYAKGPDYKCIHSLYLYKRTQMFEIHLGHSWFGAYRLQVFYILHGVYFLHFFRI